MSRGWVCGVVLFSIGVISGCAGRAARGDSQGTAGVDDAGGAGAGGAATAGTGSSLDAGAGALPARSPCAGLSEPKSIVDTPYESRELAVSGSHLAVASQDFGGSNLAVSIVDLSTLQGRSLPRTPVTVSGLAWSADALYWTEFDGSESSEVVRWSGTGEPPQYPLRAVGRFNDALFLDDALFLGSADGIDVLRAGATSLERLASADRQPLQLATDGQSLYWGECGTFWTLRRVSKQGGDVEKFGNSVCPIQLVTDGVDVYFSSNENVMQGALTSHLLRAKAGANEVAAVGAVSKTISALAMDAESVYFATSDGLFRLRRDTSEVEPITTGNVVDIALDDSCVYWTDWSANAVLTLPKP